MYIYDTGTIKIQNTDSFPNYKFLKTNLIIPDDFFPHTDVKRGDKVEAIQKYGNEQFLKHNWAMSMDHHDAIYWKYIFSNGDDPDNVFCPLEFNGCIRLEKIH